MEVLHQCSLNSANYDKFYHCYQNAVWENEKRTYKCKSPQFLYGAKPFRIISNTSKARNDCTDRIKNIQKELDSIRSALIALRIISGSINGANAGSITADATLLIDFFEKFMGTDLFGLEEKIVYPMLQYVGVRNADGFVEVLKIEHDLARMHIRTMKAELQQIESEAKTIGHRFSRAAEAFIDLLRRHLKKETKLLQTFNKLSISTERLGLVIEECQNFETNEKTMRHHEYFFAMLNALQRKYMINSEQVTPRLVQKSSN
jgi:hemerythrin-like domain-containing protein